MRPLRMMIDARMAFHGGIGTYIQHLIPFLAASSENLDHACVLGAPQKHVINVSGVKVPQPAVPLDIPNLCHQPYDAPIYSVAEQCRRPRNVHQAALWHAPHFNIPLGWRGPLVVTVHDLIHLKRPRETRSRIAPVYARFMLNRIASRARAVIVPSEATKRDLCDLTPMDASRITVIPHGRPIDSTWPTDRLMTAEILQRHRVRSRFILWVSAIRPHKNPLMALRAFARLKTTRHIPHQLVMVGQSPSWYQEPQREVQRLGLEAEVLWPGHVRPEVLPAFYQAADALVMPSYEEGFGFPVLEAMAAGLPVLVSSAGSLPELVGDAGVIIPPDDIDGWSDRLYNVLFSEELRRTLQARSRQRAQRFTWERSIAQHLDVYRTAIQ